MSKGLASQLSNAMLEGRNDDILRLGADLYDWMEAYAKEEETVELADFLVVTRLPYKETEVLTVRTESTPNAVLESKREFAIFLREVASLCRRM